MAERILSVVPGALSRRSKPKSVQLQDAIAKRWRFEQLIGAASREASPPESRDVIPLLDGWIRRLERETGTGQAQSR